MSCSNKTIFDVIISVITLETAEQLSKTPQCFPQDFVPISILARDKRELLF